MSDIAGVTRCSTLKHEFLLSLAEDFVAFGGRAQVQRRRTTLRFSGVIRKVDLPTAIAQLRAIRDRRLAEEAEFIRRIEKSGVERFFINGADLCFQRIKPVIRVCQSRRDLELFHYCRLLQSFPTTKLVGRQIRMLVLDEGQHRPALMGAVGLSSSPYSLACRDKFLRWDSEHGKHLRKKGLNALMQLSICVSFPPYSYLLAGRLMAALALCKTVADEYQKKYKGNFRGRAKLQGLVTICAAGIHCPMFHRIMLRPGGLYRRVGETAGYTTAHFSATTLDRARRLVETAGQGENGVIFGKSMRIIKSALRLCDLPYERIVKSGIKKGVYLGFSSSEAIENLRQGRIHRSVHCFSEAETVKFWKTRLVASRLCRAEVISILRRFESRTLALSSDQNSGRGDDGYAIH